MHHTVILILAFLTVFLGTVSASVFYELAESNPEYPGMCWVPSMGQAYQPNSTWQYPNICGKGTCLETDNGELKVFAVACSINPTGGPMCQIVRDFTKPYPECCAKLVCAEKTESP
ncbi:hypothetical protein SK128_024003 [Halocaridina rubra]|uniref:Single domain-containing protein n=1 Tax=Halocaridina rubra TaxID=373956 RepID=A0AAN9A649_HALRR